MSEKKKQFNQKKISWRVMLNSYLWNKDKFNEDFLKNKNITRKADVVWLFVHKKVIMYHLYVKVKLL